MAVSFAEPDGVPHLEQGVAAAQRPGIADLAAGFGVERRAVEHHGAVRAGFQPFHGIAAREQRPHRGRCVQRPVAQKRRRVAQDGRRLAVPADPAARPGAPALLGHAPLESGLVDGEISVAGEVGGQIPWKSIGVVEGEDGFPGNDAALAQPFHGALEDAHAVGKGFGEALFLPAQDPLHMGPLLRQLGKGGAHFRFERAHQPVQEGFLHAQLIAVPDGASNDPAQHVAAFLVARHHAVRDQERAGPDVIGDDPQGLVFGLRRPGHLHRAANEVPEQVRLVVGVNALHHRGQPFEAHPGVHGRFREGNQFAVFAAVELHEHQVPDLDEAVAILVRGARRAARHVRAVVVEDFAAGTAGARLAHGPEVVLLPHPAETRRVHADVLEPDVRGLVVVRVYGAPEPFGRQSQDLGDVLPGEFDRLALEVIAEAEIAEHLEEGVMPRRVADVFEIVVLAARPDATLGGDRTPVPALLAAEKDILELHHPGVGKQQRLVVGGHQRRAGDLFVPLVPEEFQERLAQFVGGRFHVLLTCERS